MGKGIITSDRKIKFELRNILQKDIGLYHEYYGNLLNKLQNIEPIKKQKNEDSTYSEIVLNTLMKTSDIEKHGLSIITDNDSKKWLLDAKKEFNNNWEKDLIDRINDLREISNEDNLPFSEKSAQGAKLFSKKIQSSVYPSTFLIGNGNIRFLWEREEEQIGIQFLNENTTQYVIFNKNGNNTYQHIGTSNHYDLIKFIKILSLYKLFN